MDQKIDEVINLSSSESEVIQVEILSSSSEANVQPNISPEEEYVASLAEYARELANLVHTLYGNTGLQGEFGRELAEGKLECLTQEENQLDSRFHSMT